MEIKTYKDWNVDGFIGEGEFGKVYKISRQDFGHIYYAALKVIEVPKSQSEVDDVRNDGMSEQNVTQYFQSVVEDIVEEFVLMSKLKGNSNIVSYEDHSVEKRKDGFGWNIYIRMELLTPLLSYIKQHKMTVRDVIQIGIDICQALEVCQKYNIIHRDIKPENIFVSDIGTYKLGDFGIARQLEKTSSGLSKKGTFKYMAPEVYKGLEYNSTVDIYSLGIVLYRFLNNNRSPFMPPASQPIRYSDKEKANIMRISGQRMPKPCNASGRLAEIVLKACAYNPSERYESAGVMRQALEEILYSDSERKLIYPAGDTLENKKADYILDETNKSIRNQVKEKPEEPEDRTFCLFNGGSQGNISETGNTFMSGINGGVYQMGNMPAQENAGISMTVAGMEEIRADNSSINIQESGIGSSKENNSQVMSGTGNENVVPPADINQQEIQQKKVFKPALKFIIPGAAVIVASVVIGIVAIAGKEPSSKVPNLEGMSIEKAEEALKADGMVLKVVEEKYSDTTDSGQIMSQSIEEGEETKQGAVIEVSVSKGKETVEEPEEEIQTIVVPDFENLSKDEAKQRASEYKLSVSIIEEFSDTIKQGTVIKQDVPKGTEAELGSSIGLIVSKGQELVAVPKIRGVKLEKAKKLLKSNKLKYKVKREYSRRFSSGTVIRQGITKGKKVEKGTIITITVSKGAKPVPTKAPQTSTYTGSSSPSGSSYSSSGSNSSSQSSGSSSYKPPAATKKPAAPKPKPEPKPKKDNSATWSLIN